MTSSSVNQKAKDTAPKLVTPLSLAVAAVLTMYILNAANVAHLSFWTIVAPLWIVPVAILSIIIVFVILLLPFAAVSLFLESKK